MTSYMKNTRTPICVICVSCEFAYHEIMVVYHLHGQTGRFFFPLSSLINCCWDRKWPREPETGIKG